ncbi:MAG: hypothetical protein GX931_06615 [Acholeplasmataceae bacterium]|nr:hypothetical protein [Acholeplasmataceae bacterium]
MLKRLKRKEAKTFNEEMEILKEKINNLEEGFLPLKERTLDFKKELETKNAQSPRIGYKQLKERLDYVMSYFQDYEQNIENARKLIQEKNKSRENTDLIVETTTNFDEYILELNEIALELKEIEIEMQEIFDKKEKKSPVLDFKEFGDMIGDAFKKVFNKDDSSNPNSKTNKLLKILPFLDKEEKKEIVKEILSDSEYFEGIKLVVIMPFLDEEDCDKIFMHQVKKDDKNLQSLLPFVSEGLLEELVNKYINGEIDMNMDMLYPFLKVEDIKKIFFYELKR